MFRNPSNDSTNHLVMVFSSAGHFLFHYVAAMFFTIVVALAREWQAPYHELIQLWTPGLLLIGLAALPAGRLADTWSAPAMMIIMFIGMGLAGIACSLVNGRLALLLGLAAVGLFAAIYHPVGISWLVRSRSNRPGRLLAINGVFGGFGAAAAGILSGWLSLVGGWRLAFVIPGVLCLLTGLWMLFLLRRGAFNRSQPSQDQNKSLAYQLSGDLYGFSILLFPMFSIGLIYNTMQGIMPKLFEEQAVELLQGNIAWVGTLVGLVYFCGALMQLVGGWLADRYDLKKTYFLLWLTQAPLLILISVTQNISLILVSALVVVFHTAILPSENLLISRYAPERHQGVAFGIKFVLAFGAGPLGVELISLVREMTGSFDRLLLGMAAVGLLAALAVLLLPSIAERPLRPGPSSQGHTSR